MGRRLFLSSLQLLRWIAMALAGAWAIDILLKPVPHGIPFMLSGPFLTLLFVVAWILHDTLSAQARRRS